VSRLFCWFVLLGILVACSNEGELASSTVAELPPSSTSTAPPEPKSPDTAAISTSTSLPAEFPSTRTEIDLGWETVEIPEPVAFCHQAAIATDNELVFWGGNRASCEYETPVGDPGMAYNSETGIWRRLPPGPLEPAVAPTGVWTGSEILICCGIAGVAQEGGGEIGSSQAAAYDPETETWRRLSDAPLGGPFPISVWTGTEMMVVTRDGVAAYDVSADEWHVFSDPPDQLGRTNEVAWTGSELIVWPSTVTRKALRGMALDPSSDTWRVLSDPPAWPAALDLVYTGDTLIIWGGLPAERGSERAVGSRLDLPTNEWTELPEPLPEPDGCECNLGSQTLVWTGEYLLVSPGFFSTGLNPTAPVLIAYHPGTDTWILVDDETPIGLATEGHLVGERILIKGHVITGSNRMFVSPAGWQPTGEVISGSGS
jgi:hypothetical protein